MLMNNIFKSNLTKQIIRGIKHTKHVSMNSKILFFATKQQSYTCLIFH